MSRSGIMLCYPFEEKRLSKWQAPYIIQPKLDGDRCRAIIDSDGEVVLLSSEMNTIQSVPHINSALKNLHLRNVELDGELYIHGAPHEIIHGIVSRTENMHPDYKLVELHIFDIITSKPQVQRTTDLIHLIPHSINNFSPIQLVPNRIAESIDDIMKTLDDYMENSYEGFIIRNASGIYARKRSTDIMKFKPRKEDLYEIIDFQEEINKDGIPKMALGAFICRGDDGSLFNVGSGSLLTRENREAYWKDRDKIKGKLARVRYQHMSYARGVPRFPVVVEIV